MDSEERRAGSKRLLSFDASHMSLSRLGKAFYTTPNSKQQPQQQSTKSKGITTTENCTTDFNARGSIVCMAVNPEHAMAALVSKEGIDVVRLEGKTANTVTSYKANSNLRLLPTAAAWQGKRRSVTSEIDDSTVASFFPSQPLDKTHLAVADSNGSVRIYGFSDNSAGTNLNMLASSTNAGRPIRSVSFNTEQQNLFIAAVSDGSNRLWDLRQGLKRPVLIFNRTGDVAREVQFQPGSEFKFASIYDSGVVQRWDIRQRQSPDYRINAHQQGISLDWHPYLNYLATGGRDHLVQVWNMNTDGGGNSGTDLLGGGSSPEHVVQAPNSVSELSWVADPGVPIWKSQIVTSGRKIESNNRKGTYSVWSLSRPHIPKYTIETHKDAITSVFAMGSNLVWSTGLDKKFWQTDLRYEPTVASNLPPAIVAMPPWDMAGVSFPVSQFEEPTLAPPTGLSVSHPSYIRRASQQSIPKLPTKPQTNTAMPSLGTDSSAATNRRPPNFRTNSMVIQRNHSMAAFNTPNQAYVSQTAPSSAAPSACGSLTNSGNAFPAKLGNTSTPNSGNNSATNSGHNSVANSISTSLSKPQIPFASISPGSQHEFNMYGNSTGNISPSYNQQHGFTNGHFINTNAANFHSGSNNTTAPATPVGVNPATDAGEPGDLKLPPLDLKYVIEVGLPFEDSKSMCLTANSLSFIKEFGQTYGDVCRKNAQVMMDGARFRYSEVWLLLAASIDQLEAAFLRKLAEGTSNQEKEEYALAEAWFGGLVGDNYEVRAVAIDDRTTRDEVAMAADEIALFEDAGIEAEDESMMDPDWPASPQYLGSASTISMPSALSNNSSRKWSASRRYKHRFASMYGSQNSTNRPTTPLELLNLKEKDPFQVLKEKYYKFVQEQDKPWNFLPVLKDTIRKSLQAGYYVSCTAIILMFKAFPGLGNEFNFTELVQAGLHFLYAHSAFVPAAFVRKILKHDATNGNNYFDYDSIIGGSTEEGAISDIPDTVCHRCIRSLSDNAAFYARNDTSVGYWYCLKCRLKLEGCSLCDELIIGLCIANISCGHRAHLECWNQWVTVEGMQECPSGCGQSILNTSTEVFQGV